MIRCCVVIKCGCAYLYEKDKVETSVARICVNNYVMMSNLDSHPNGPNVHGKPNFIVQKLPRIQSELLSKKARWMKILEKVQTSAYDLVFQILKS